MTRERTKIVILGSTGSIGRQAVEVCAHYADRLEVVALAAHSNAHILAEQAQRLKVPKTVLTVREGPEALVALAQHPEAELVLNALVGAAGLQASHAALTAGKTLALANKESLVVGGELLMPLARSAALLPVDSEHSALFQCLVGEQPVEVARLWVTASGGPLRGCTRAQLATVTREQALAHPNWSMGAKISIDSATLMNKGLEVIEAHHLFELPYERIEVVQHPQSTVHSLIEFIDGSFKAHLGYTDMRIPIQYALSYPRRWEAVFAEAALDLRTLGSLSFEPADAETFGCLRLALEAGHAGGTAPCVLNAANEVAVAAFLEGSIAFLDIERLVEACLSAHNCQAVSSLEQLMAVDVATRANALQLIENAKGRAKTQVI